jgi:3-oxoacyl-(acyl carrier protein) synthase III
MGKTALKSLERANMNLDELDYFIPHQANIRIIDSAAKRLHMPKEKVFVNLHKYGNTSAASVAIALDEANREGCLKRGDNVALAGFGAGLTWASLVLKWY